MSLEARTSAFGLNSRFARWLFAGLASLAWACSSPDSADRASVDRDAAVVNGDPDPTLTDAERATLLSLSPSALPPSPADISNRFADDAAAARLGQALFFEPMFSGALHEGDNDGSPKTLGTNGQTGKVACAGCHTPQSGFSDDRSLGGTISLGAGWGRRRAPSLLDVGQAKVIMWDGKHDALYNQPFGPIESPVEMNSSRLYTAEQLFAHYRTPYEAIFGAMPPLDDVKRFPPLTATQTGCQPNSIDIQPVCDGITHGMPGDGAEFDHLSPSDQDAVTRVVVNMGKAIAAYERLLTCGPGRFDQWMHGDASALTRSEQRGAQVFVRAGCVNCHSGPFLSDQKFHNVGLYPKPVATTFKDVGDKGAYVGLTNTLADPLNVRGKFSDGDDGRLPTSVDASLTGAFRTPILRCVARRPSFMHTAQIRSLDAVVAFFNQGGDVGGFEGTSEIHALGLSDLEQVDLTAFLGTLEGSGPIKSLLAPP